MFLSQTVSGRRSRAGLVVAGTLCASMLLASPAFAETVGDAPQDVSPTETAERVQEVLSDISELEETGTAGPVDLGGSGLVQVSSMYSDRPDASLSVNGQFVVNITFAESESTAPAVTPDSEFEVYGEVAESTDVAVREIDSGAQLLAVLNDADAAPSQAYDLTIAPGYAIAPSAEGFIITDPAGNLAGIIEQPWAQDATGKSLPTHYTLDGDRLVQHVDTTGAVYPIVADPKVSVGWGVYLAMNGAEIKMYQAAIAIVGLGALAVTCTNTDRIPHALLKQLANLVCMLTGGVTLTQMWQAIKDISKNPAVINSACYQMKWVPKFERPVKVSSDKCKY